MSLVNRPYVAQSSSSGNFLFARAVTKQKINKVLYNNKIFVDSKIIYILFPKIIVSNE